MDEIAKINWTLKEMRALHHVIQLGTVTAAGNRMGLSQPAVSRMLFSLEAKLGKPLFERQGRTLAPTQWALDFYASSTKVFEAIENMRQCATDSDKADLRIAVPPTFAQGFLQEAVGVFLRSYGNVKVLVDVRSSPSIFEIVSEGLVDLGITDMLTHQEAIHDKAFRRAAMVCFMRKDHPLTQYDEVNLDKVNEIEVVGLTRRHATRSQMDRLLEKAHVNWRMIVETSTATAAVSFVEKTGAVAFLSPFPVARELPPEVTYRPLHNGPIYITRFVFPARIGLKSLTRQFMRAAMDVSQFHDAWSEPS